VIEGVDVSSYQPTNYDTSGLGFVFVKATEGTGYVNPVQAAQAATGRAAGLVVGFYHYLDSSASMQAQAQYFVSQCDSQAGDILALDWEETSVSGADKDAFLAAVKQLRPNHKLVLYCNTYFWTSLDTTSNCADGLWIADITAAGQPRVQHPWTFHQYSDAGGIDRDVANFPSAAALRSWAAGSAPSPTPTPTPAPTPQESDMPQQITGTVVPGAQPTVVLPPSGAAWSAYPNRKLHLGLDAIGDPTAKASVRVAIHNGSTWRESMVTVTAAGSRVDVDMTAADVKVSLQTEATGVGFAIESW
jgi:hypothetical protein